MKFDSKDLRVIWCNLQGYEKIFHFSFGEDVPLDTAKSVHGVKEIHAKGEGLMHIIESFDGIPKPDKFTIVPETEYRWFGDDAKFIVANFYQNCDYVPLVK